MPEGKFRVAMAGRSVMRQWFKYWNYPRALSRYAVHFPWPIPWKEYAKDGFYFRYVQIVQPRADGPGEAYGQEALAALRRQVSGERVVSPQDFSVPVRSPHQEFPLKQNPQIQNLSS